MVAVNNYQTTQEPSHVHHGFYHSCCSADHPTSRPGQRHQTPTRLPRPATAVGDLGPRLRPTTPTTPLDFAILARPTAPPRPRPPRRALLRESCGARLSASPPRRRPPGLHPPRPSRAASALSLPPLVSTGPRRGRLLRQPPANGCCPGAGRDRFRRRAAAATGPGHA